jgi:hypothetical protein
MGMMILTMVQMTIKACKMNWKATKKIRLNLIRLYKHRSYSRESAKCIQNPTKFFPRISPLLPRGMPR